MSGEAVWLQGEWGEKKCIAGGAGELFSVFAFSEVLCERAVNDKGIVQCVQSLQILLQQLKGVGRKWNIS